VPAPFFGFSDIQNTCHGGQKYNISAKQPYFSNADCPQTGVNLKPEKLN